MRFALPQVHFLSTLLSPSANCQKARAAAIRARPCPPKTKALGRHAAGGRSYSKNALSGAGAAAEQSEEPVETHAATSRAAIFTGSYAFLGGVALVLAPNTVFGEAGNGSSVSQQGWHCQPATDVSCWRCNCPARVSLTNLDLVTLTSCGLMSVLLSTGLVFDASTVPDAWIRVGGVILSTFGAQVNRMSEASLLRVMLVSPQA
jgi:hypothetical protein